MRMAELYPFGETVEIGSLTFSAEDIMRFAGDFDPQPFHIDVEAARAGPFGGLIASGFQTLLVAFRLVHQERIINAASLGSPGLDELRWLRPVRPGDTLRVTGEVREVAASRSKPDRGIVTIAYAVTDGSGAVVMTFRVMHLLRRNSEAG